MSIYVSQGTIRIVASDDVNVDAHVANFAAYRGAEERGPNALLHFSPSAEYSIKHWDRDFAVFVSPVRVARPAPEVYLMTREEFPAPLSRKALVREYSQRKVIEVDTKIHMADLPDIISSAASNQTNVQIRVKPNRNRVGVLDLVGIEIPAT